MTQKSGVRLIAVLLPVLTVITAYFNLKDHIATTIEIFRSNAYSVPSGDHITLTWRVKGYANHVFLDGQPVARDDARDFIIDGPRTLTLRAQGFWGGEERRIEITQSATNATHKLTGSALNEGKESSGSELGGGPEDASQQYRLGLDLYRKNKPRDAVEAFNRAIDLDPRHAESYVQIGSILAEDPHSRDQAISYLQEGLKLSPEDSVAHSLLAVLYRQDRRYGDSISESKKAIAISPLNPAFHLGLAMTLEENQRCEEAIGEVREAIRSRLNYANAYYHLALCQEKAGAWREAKQSWQVFLQLATQRQGSSAQVRTAREHLSRNY